MSGRVTSGYNACVHCDNVQLSHMIINKICYMGHRCFLPKPHSFRKNNKCLQFIGGKEDNRPVPEQFKSDELQAHLEAVRNVKPGKPPAEGAPTVPAGSKRKRNEDAPNIVEGTKKKKGGEVAAGAKGKEKEGDKPRIFYKRRATLQDLPYWSAKKLRHNIDVMHLEKNICDSVVGTLMNNPSKTKDSSNARLDCATLKVNKHLQLDPDDKVTKGKEKHYKFRGAEFTHCRCIRGNYFVSSSEV